MGRGFSECCCRTKSKQVETERSRAGSRAYKWLLLFLTTRPQLFVQCHIRTSSTNLSPLLHPSPKDFPPPSFSLCIQSYLIYFRLVTSRLDHLLKGQRNLRWRSKISHIPWGAQCSHQYSDNACWFTVIQCFPQKQFILGKICVFCCENGEFFHSLGNIHRLYQK